MVKRKIPKTIKKTINDYLQILDKDKLPIKEAIVFGSFAKGKQKKWSDIDICVVSPKFKNRNSALRYLWMKKRNIANDRKSEEGHDLEPVGFNPKDFINEDPLVWEIKQYGVKVR